MVIAEGRDTDARGFAVENAGIDTEWGFRGAFEAVSVELSEYPCEGV